jgi:hypothetical protein
MHTAWYGTRFCFRQSFTINLVDLRGLYHDFLSLAHVMPGAWLAAVPHVLLGLAMCAASVSVCRVHADDAPAVHGKAREQVKVGGAATGAAAAATATAAKHLHQQDSQQ